MLAEITRKTIFRVKQLHLARGLCFFRKLYWRAQGMQIGHGSKFSTVTVTWPHKVALGENCSLEHDIYLNAAGPYSDGVSIRLGAGCFVGKGCEFNISHHLTVGENTLIAAGSRFIDHNHGIAAGAPIKGQPETSAPIMVGPDVWIGANSLILQGVSIGEGAVVAAGSVVTHSVPAFTVVAGCPARPMRDRRQLRGAGAQGVGAKGVGAQLVAELAGMLTVPPTAHHGMEGHIPSTARKAALVN